MALMKPSEHKIKNRFSGSGLIFCNLHFYRAENGRTKHSVCRFETADAAVFFRNDFHGSCPEPLAAALC